MFSAKTTHTMLSMYSALRMSALRIGASLALIVFAASVQAADSTVEREYVIKAGFLSNFFSYVDWPLRPQEQNPSVYVIGVVGENPFEAAEEKLRGKIVKGRRIEFRQVKDLSDLSQYHVIFVRASEQSRMPEVLERTRNTPTLTVGEHTGFIRDGGVINLVPARNRFQIEINPAAAERAGLTISAQLLKLAQIVRS